MTSNSIKKLISEGVAQAWSQHETAQVTSSMLQHDISFIKDFAPVGKKVINGVQKWKFTHNSGDDGYMSDVIITQYPNDTWSMKLEVFWRVKTKENTSGAGKDFTRVFGPFTSYEIMCEELKRILHNNPMMGSGIYQDNHERSMDKEMVQLLVRLKEKIGEIKELDSPVFKGLIQMYEVIKNIPDEKGLMKFADDIAPGWLKKQTFIFNLQLLDKIPFYQQLKKAHTSGVKPFEQKQ